MIRLLIAALFVGILVEGAIHRERRLEESPQCKVLTVTNYDFKRTAHEMSQEMVGQHSHRILSDAYYGPITEYQMAAAEFPIYHDRFLPNLLPCLQHGAIVYVMTNWLPTFISQFYDKITVPFVLVTAGSDTPTPSGAAHAKFMEKDSKILHWYANNCDQNPDPTRFTCTPLGLRDFSAKTGDMYSHIRNNFSEYNPIVNYKEHVKSVHPHEQDRRKVRAKNSTFDVLMPYFNMGTHRDRRPVWEMMCGPLAAGTSPNYLHKNANNVTTLCTGRLSELSMVTETIQSKFVISPHGMGLDCHRTWESLYLGAFVIVQKSSLDEMYVDLPVLILDKWADLSLDILTAAYEKFTHATYTYDVMRMAYWYEKYRSHSTNHEHVRYETTVDPELLKQKPLVDLHIKEGDLIMGANKLVYQIRNGTKCPIPSLEIFMSYPGWDFSNARRFTDYQISEIYDGPNVEKYVSPPVRV